MNGTAVGLVGIAATMATWAISPGISVPIFWAGLVALVGLLLTMTLLHAALSAFRSASKRLPSVTYACAPPAPYSGIVALLLLEPSAVFTPGSAVSIMQRRDELEVLIALGHVISVQENGRIQVGVGPPLVEDPDLLNSLTNNNKTVIEKLIVKPTVPSFARSLESPRS